jgi:RHS repeat-associated protein
LIAVLAVGGYAPASEPGTVEFRPEYTSFAAPGGELISQTVSDKARFSPGVMLVTLSPDVDASTIGRGVHLGRITDQHLSWVDRTDYAMALLDVDPPTVIILPFAGWERDVDYAIRVDETVKDTQGGILVPGGGTWVSTIESIKTEEDIASLPPDVAAAVEDFKAREKTKKTRTAKASSSDPVGCFPGGQNLLWKGGWTDPTTGLMYFRGRWYDPRTGSWLSPDPKGPIDSPNLYAGFAWAPHMYNDPMGMALLVTQGNAQQVRIEDERNIAELHAFLASKGYTGDAQAFLQAMVALNPNVNLANLNRNQTLNFTGLSIPQPVPQGGNLPGRLVTSAGDVIDRHRNATQDVEAARQLRALGMPGPNVQGARTGIRSPEWTNPATRRELADCGVDPIDCIGYPSEVVASALATGGDAAGAARYRNRTSAVGMQSDLVSEGWTAYYFTADSSLTANPGDPQWQRDTAYLNTLLFSSSDTYLAGAERFEVTGVISDYGLDASGNPNAALELLRSIPFGVGSFEGGMHTFILMRGSVYEVHWDRSHDDSDLFQIRPIEDQQLLNWSHGVIVVPPEQ